MEKIILAYETLQRACRSLHKVVERFITAHNDPRIDKETRDERRDATIKRFELCYDLFWKYGKNYLILYHEVDIPSPKKVFQELSIKKVIAPEDTETLRDIAEIRNLTVHTYDEAYADEAAEKIIEYLKALETILKKLAPEK
jgi:nucleotidyltransferase substrate binding protein (TIGR01987 family)